MEVVSELFLIVNLKVISDDSAQPFQQAFGAESSRLIIQQVFVLCSNA